MENSKFNGFMVFIAAFMTLVFVSLKMTFLVSFLCSLIFVILIRALWIVYGLVWNVIGRSGISEKFGEKDKQPRKFKG